MPEFYNPSGETQKHGVKLPHWQQGEVMQFGRKTTGTR